MTHQRAPVAHTVYTVLHRDEQYRQLWAELESYVRAHAASSPQHQSVLDCLLECKRPDDTSAKPVLVKAAEDRCDDVFVGVNYAQCCCLKLVRNMHVHVGVAQIFTSTYVRVDS